MKRMFSAISRWPKLRWALQGVNDGFFKNPPKTAPEKYFKFYREGYRLGHACLEAEK